MLFVSGIFSSTIKSNILFGKGYDQQLFERVAQATALDIVSTLVYLTYGVFGQIGFQSIITWSEYTCWRSRRHVIWSK
jgi:ABC-type multidrug transport system fused ATPase/permease subunit